MPFSRLNILFMSSGWHYDLYVSLRNILQYLVIMQYFEIVWWNSDKHLRVWINISWFGKYDPFFIFSRQFFPSSKKIMKKRKKSFFLSCYLELLYKLQKWIYKTVATSLEPLAHCWNEASLSLFYKYYFGRWGFEWTFQSCIVEKLFDNK